MIEVEQNNRRTPSPRPPRLSPLREMALDIQRESTPLPEAIKPLSTWQEQNLAQRIPDFWLYDTDSGEGEGGFRDEAADPLLGRRFPDRAEIARLEAEDERRAKAERRLWRGRQYWRAPTSRRMRVALLVLLCAAICMLVLDSALVVAGVMRTHSAQSAPGGPPLLTLSTNVASVGQIIRLSMQHFAPGSHLLLTHDVQEPVQLASGTGLVSIGAGGSADMRLPIDKSWKAGLHTVQAEDILTHYTASATLQVAGLDAGRPSHLMLDASSMNLGVDRVGANTIQGLTLENAGDGSVTWNGSSNQPWLLFSPSWGTFNASQTIAVAVARAHLKVGNYQGVISFASSEGEMERLAVQMSVEALPVNESAVLEVTPPVFTFSAFDGEGDPNEQELMVSNAGSQALNWSITANTPIVMSSQSQWFHAFATKQSWLSTDVGAGIVPPHGTSIIHIAVENRNLLPGVYAAMLVFRGGKGALDSPQEVEVTLTVQPGCGLMLSTGLLSFTTMANGSGAGEQPLGLTATSSCAGSIGWRAVASASWLTVTPSSGKLKGAAAIATLIGIEASGLKPGLYDGYISLLTSKSSQDVTVQLMVQASPSPQAPILGVSPLSLSFSMAQGMPNPPGQVVTITNNGHSALTWHATVNALASKWLSIGATGGSIGAGQTGELLITINAAGLMPNTYMGQIGLSGMDANGERASESPQVITVELAVLPPCTLEKPSLSVLSFSAIAGSSDPAPQLENISASGDCAWPLSWSAQIVGSAPWLQPKPEMGTLAGSGQSGVMAVGVTSGNLAPGVYSAQVEITAVDGANMPAQDSPQLFTVTFSVLSPCSLQLGQSTLTFSVVEGQAPPMAQQVAFNEAGACSRPIGWTAAGDGNSSQWMAVTPSAGSDNGAGSTVSIAVNSQLLLPGTYTGTVTIAVSGNNGGLVEGSPQAVTVTLTVTGFQLAGQVVACSDQQCSGSNPLPQATVTLLDANGHATTVTADGSGNYGFADLAAGVYTLTVSGSYGGVNYAGTATVNLSGDEAQFTVNAYLTQ